MIAPDEKGSTKAAYCLTKSPGLVVSLYLIENLYIDIHESLCIEYWGTCHVDDGPMCQWGGEFDVVEVIQFTRMKRK